MFNQQLNLLNHLRDLIQDRAMRPSGIPWMGRKQPAPFMGYLPQVQGNLRRLGKRVYDAAATGGGWRVLNKPQSRRARHRLAVAARKAASR